MAAILALLMLVCLVGVIKPFVQGLTRAHFGIAAVVCFVLIGVLGGSAKTSSAPANSASGSVVASTEATAKADEPPPEPVSKWTYSTNKDEMRGTTEHLAEIQSENTVDLQFPYGEVHGTVWIRRRPSDGLNIAFSVDKGQILCHNYSDSYVSIKFDDQPVQRFSCTGTSDGSSETAFIENAGRALSGLKKSKRTIIEAEFFQQGRKQFTFETAKLEWK
jgi:hypothetical protein